MSPKTQKKRHGKCVKSSKSKGWKLDHDLSIHNPNLPIQNPNLPVQTSQNTIPTTTCHICNDHTKLVSLYELGDYGLSSDSEWICENCMTENEICPKCFNTVSIYECFNTVSIYELRKNRSFICSQCEKSEKKGGISELASESEHDTKFVKCWKCKEKIIGRMHPMMSTDYCCSPCWKQLLSLKRVR